jgi:hypothetical protein
MKIIMKNFLKTEIMNVLDEVRMMWIEDKKYGTWDVKK